MSKGIAETTKNGGHLLDETSLTKNKTVNDGSSFELTNGMSLKLHLVKDKTIVKNSLKQMLERFLKNVLAHEKNFL